MKKTLIITLATVVLIAAAVTAALFTLTAASSHQTCGKIDVAELQRAVADPSYKKRLERLARCAAPTNA
jgi:hypothetical protein